ncbi:MAG: hypothetical protein IIA75_11550 [Proteobacteria bacterium]|nr:hypothetical protein [Pseudomonadota bacterium]
MVSQRKEIVIHPIAFCRQGDIRIRNVIASNRSQQLARLGLQLRLCPWLK